MPLSLYISTLPISCYFGLVKNIFFLSFPMHFSHFFQFFYMNSTWTITLFWTLTKRFHCPPGGWRVSKIITGAICILCNIIRYKIRLSLSHCLYKLDSYRNTSLSILLSPHPPFFSRTPKRNTLKLL